MKATMTILISVYDLKNLAVSEDWFESGLNPNYEKLIDIAEKAHNVLLKMALLVYNGQRNTVQENVNLKLSLIMELIDQECCTTSYNIEN